MHEFYARARAVLLPDGLSGGGWRAAPRREEPMHRCNPLIETVIWRTRSVLTLGFPKAQLARRPRHDLERLVRAIIDEVAAALAIGLSPEERREAVSEILAEHQATGTLPMAPAAAA